MMYDELSDKQALDEHLLQYRPIDEDFLHANILPDNEKELKEANQFIVDPEKLHFVPTGFDRYYYKKKYPLLEDEVCEILERCSIENMHLKTEPIQEQPKKKPGITIEHKKTIVDFS